MDYETEIGIDSDAHSVVNHAVHTLVGCGMTLDRREMKEATLSGPGLRSTNQNPLLGATSIRLIERDHPTSRVIIHADLGGVRWMGKFIIRLPLFLAMGFLSLYAVVELVGPQFGMPAIPDLARWTVLSSILLTTLPWFAIRPLFVRKLTTKTEQAIENLIRSADQLAKCEASEPVAVE